MTKEHIEKVIRSNRPSIAAHQLFKEIEAVLSEAESMALSLEALGIKLCTPLSRYRKMVPRKSSPNDAP